MKKSTYKLIDQVGKLVRSIQFKELLESLRKQVEDEREEWDNHSDNWQDSEKGEEANETIQNAEALVCYLEDLKEELSSIVSQVEIIENDAPEGAFN